MVTIGYGRSATADSQKAQGLGGTALHSQAAQYTAGQRARLRTCDLAVARCRSGQFPGPPVDAMLPLMPYKLPFVCGPLVSEPDSGLSRKFTRVGGMSGQGA